MTFTNGSGFERIDPIEYDELLGGMWTIDLAESPCGLAEGKGRPQCSEGVQVMAEGHPRISHHPQQGTEVVPAEPSDHLER